MKYKYGFLVPNNHDDVIQLDQQNKNTKWHEAENLEVTLLHDYKAR